MLVNTHTNISKAKCNTGQRIISDKLYHLDIQNISKWLKAKSPQQMQANISLFAAEELNAP